MANPVRKTISFQSLDVFDQSLVAGGWRWVTPGQNAPTISFCFSGKYSDWTNAEMQGFRSALQSYASIFNINFREVKNPSLADWVEYSANANTIEKITKIDGVIGVHGNAQIAASSTASTLGGRGQAFGYFNNEGYAPASLKYDPHGLVKGGYGYNTFVHEIGHALGLAHPFDTGSGSSRLPGVNGVNDYGTGVAYQKNQGLFTVMSYNYGWERVFDPEGNGIASRGYAAGPMALDIHALSNLYGLRQTSSANNDYVISDSKSYWQTIFDTGGTDSIVYNGKKDVTISLAAATDSWWGQYPDGFPDTLFVSSINNRNGGFVIGRDVEIEIGKGGSGNDYLVSGLRTNVSLYGRDGNDSLLTGRSGNHLFGGAGDDHLSAAIFSLSALDSIEFDGGAGNDTIIAGQSFNCTCSGGEGNDTMSGGAGSMVDGGDGDDQLTFTGAQNTIKGGNGNDVISVSGFYAGTGVRTSVEGGSGQDTFQIDRFGISTNSIVFHYAAKTDSGITDLTRDAEFTFVSTDIIDLSQIDANETLANHQDFTFSGAISQGASLKIGELVFIALGNAEFIIEADVDGDTIADFQIAVRCPGFDPAIGNFIL